MHAEGKPERAIDALRERSDAESSPSLPEHAPSVGADVAAHVSNRPSIPPPPDPSATPSYISENQRQTVANILQSLTGGTLAAVLDANQAHERRCRELIGQRVNNFEIIGLLSSGGMGDVFEAIHLVIHRKVAIKVLRQEHVADPALVQRFFNEARAANSIRHPNIVEILDVGMLPSGLPYIAMERLEGETLAQRLAREGKLEIDRAVDFAVQAASALQAAHKRGIVHRDLKPDNLFIVPDPRVAGRELIKVLDFGIAKLHGDKLSQVKTNVGSILGTPPYMSPEQCRGIPDAVDHRSDVYALGVILFEMLCGAPPFVAEGVGDVMVMHLSSPPPLPRWRRQEIPLRIEQTILWAMEKNPDQRIPGMADFIFTLSSGPTPVPYIVTPTGLTTAELPANAELDSAALVPKYLAPAISLEGEFPTEESTGDEAVGNGRAARVQRRNSTPPQGYRIERRSSRPPAGEVADSTVPTEGERVARASGAPPARSSWRSLASRGVAVGALGVAAAVAAVVGTGRWSSNETRLGARDSETPAPARERLPASSDRELGVATGALRTSSVAELAPVDVVPPANEVAPAQSTSTGADPGVPVAPSDVPPASANVGASRPLASPGPRWIGRAARGGAPLPAAGDKQAVIDAANRAGGPAASPEAQPAVAGSVPDGSLPPTVAVSPVATPSTSVSPASTPPRATDPGLAPVQEAAMGTLNFDSSPWARVSVDGRVLGVTPLRGVHLPPGTHLLRLENSELGTATSVVVEVKAGQSVSRFVGWEQRP